MIDACLACYRAGHGPGVALHVPDPRGAAESPGARCAPHSSDKLWQPAMHDHAAAQRSRRTHTAPADDDSVMCGATESPCMPAAAAAAQQACRCQVSSAFHSDSILPTKSCRWTWHRCPGAGACGRLNTCSIGPGGRLRSPALFRQCLDSQACTWRRAPRAEHAGGGGELHPGSRAPLLRQKPAAVGAQRPAAAAPPPCQNAKRQQVPSEEWAPVAWHFLRDAADEPQCIACIEAKR